MDSIIAYNLQVVRERISSACERVGRNPEEITLIVVTKTIDPERINEAIDAGAKHIGENRVQEAWEKFPAIKPATRHLIGHLQTNKTKRAVQIFDWIQSVDSFHLAEKIDQEASKLGKTIPILLEVKTSPEETKYGVSVSETMALVEKISTFDHLRIKGLMTIAPFTDDEKTVRKSFQGLRNLRDAIKQAKITGVEMKHLSMGMSSDFEIAVEEGATMVRIGTAIFGPRN